MVVENWADNQKTEAGEKANKKERDEDIWW